MFDSREGSRGARAAALRRRASNRSARDDGTRSAHARAESEEGGRRGPRRPRRARSSTPRRRPNSTRCCVAVGSAARAGDGGGSELETQGAAAGAEASGASAILLVAADGAPLRAHARERERPHVHGPASTAAQFCHSEAPGEIRRARISPLSTRGVPRGIPVPPDLPRRASSLPASVGRSSPHRAFRRASRAHVVPTAAARSARPRRAKEREATGCRGGGRHPSPRATRATRSGGAAAAAKSSRRRRRSARPPRRFAGAVDALAPRRFRRASPRWAAEEQSHGRGSASATLSHDVDADVGLVPQDLSIDSGGNRSTSSRTAPWTRGRHAPVSMGPRRAAGDGSRRRRAHDAKSRRGRAGRRGQRRLRAQRREQRRRLPGLASTTTPSPEPLLHRPRQERLREEGGGARRACAADGPALGWAVGAPTR